MTISMFITVAPVGAVPQIAIPGEPKFLSASLFEAGPGQPGLKAELEAARIRLSGAGWEPVDAGGLAISESLTGDGQDVTPGGPRPLPRRLLEIAGDVATSRNTVLCLTSQGWLADGDGNLQWPQAVPCETFLPPDLVSAIRDHAPVSYEALLALGWTVCGPGYWQPGKASSPRLPVTPDAIVEESLLALREGAAIVHLHTRSDGDRRTVTLPGLAAPIIVGQHKNHIDAEQFARIVPRLRERAPAAIVNLSTSSRGGAADSEELRRTHIRRYGAQALAPELASFSPGEVLFQAGGGYGNPPDFLERQMAHFSALGTRPEVEVFNSQILHHALGDYAGALAALGEPVLFMLVVGVDQHRRGEDGSLLDDSLIPPAERRRILDLIAKGDEISLGRAVDAAVMRLEPVVARIRDRFPGAKISALMAGAMQVILARAAVALGLDGVRVGLEDGLNVVDDAVPGGLRRGSSAEQVRSIHRELTAMDVHVLDAEELREALDMPAPAVRTFKRCVEALRSIAAPALRPRPLAAEVLAALAGLRQGYEALETAFFDGHRPPAGASAAERADHAVRALAAHGLYVRYFIEERDRYPAEGAAAFKAIYRLQALNFMRELAIERGADPACWDDALGELAREAGLPDSAYRVEPQQFKGPDLRFLDYLISIPCRYNGDRTDVAHTALRRLDRYSATMSLLFEAINQLTLDLRRRSGAEAKHGGILVYSAADPDNLADPAQPQGALLVETMLRGGWIVLPSTPTTHYPEGLKLSRGLTATVAGYLGRVLPVRNGKRSPVFGIVHAGLDENGDPLVESAMLQNRFALNTSAHEMIVGYSARLIYERCILPRLVESPATLDWGGDGLVRRDARGVPLHAGGRPARRISFQGIDDLVPLKFLAHSSGIATIQQMDNAMRQDMLALGYSGQEQEELFNRCVVVSFASACDVNTEVTGTPVVDVTAFNDVRSMAGTTTEDYLLRSADHRAALAATIRGGEDSADFRYDGASWILRRGRGNKTLLRLRDVWLREDPLRLHDGHSIRRYLEGAPDFVEDLLRLLDRAPRGARMDVLLRQHVADTARRADRGDANRGDAARSRLPELAGAGGA